MTSGTGALEQWDPSSSVDLRTEERVYTASQWTLMWWRFRRHKLAVVSTAVLFVLYVTGAFCEFFAPHDPRRYEVKLALAPPQTIHFVDETGFQLRPFVYAYRSKRNMETLALEFEEDKSKKLPIHLFVRGDPYKLWGMWESDLHLFGVRDPDEMLLLLGADETARDVLSRIIYGSRTSLSVGVVGILFSFSLGILLGGLSGYYGGVVDTIIQRAIELLRSLPGIPLWLTMAAAMPRDWPPLRIYFGITVILSLLSWTGLARVVRGRFLSLREEDFVLAARLGGTGELRIILYHMAPAMTSHLIATLTLSIPAMVLSETALSFLGLGLQPPVISWGVLLKTAQNLRSVISAPWLLTPGVALILFVMASDFVGDGLRDAADPYAR
jgi:peptide/nickel transport system permease protein